MREMRVFRESAQEHESAVFSAILKRGPEGPFSGSAVKSNSMRERVGELVES